MGEAQRRAAMGGPQFNQLKPGQQIPVDLTNAMPKVCDCGSDLFIPAVKLFTVSALVSPTGQELTAQQAVLVCMTCNAVLK